MVGDIRAVADTFAEIDAMVNGRDVKGKHVPGFLEEFPLNEGDVIEVAGVEYYFKEGKYLAKEDCDKAD